MDHNIFTGVGKYIGRTQKKQTAEGRIVSIQGVIAWVSINGSGQFQEAWYNKGSQLSAGDKCTLQRNPRDARWTITSGYNTSQGHANNTEIDAQGVTTVAAVAPPSSTGSANYNGTAYTITTNTYVVLESVNITLPEGKQLLVTFTGTAAEKSSSLANQISLAINYGTSDIVAIEPTTDGFSSTRFYRNCSFVLPVPNLAAGTYTVQLKAKILGSLSGSPQIEIISRSLGALGV